MKDLLILFALFIVFLCAYFKMSSLMDETGELYYQDRVRRKRKHHKVYDIMHKILPDMSSERMMTLHDIITALFIIPVIFNVEMFKEYIGYWLVVFTIRTIVINITILPKDKKCTVKKMRWDFLKTCYDKIFSGHFSSVFLAVLLYIKYGWINVYQGVVICVIESINILLTRSHYTVDIIVAILVCTIVYQNNLSINTIIKSKEIV
jgi:hypothetical protein